MKDASPEDMVDAVRKAARGEAVMHPRVAAQVMRLLSGREEDAAPALLADLSRREIEVLRLVAEGLSKAAFAERLFISEKTVKSHVSNVLGKLHLEDRTQAAVFAWRSGFMER